MKPCLLFICLLSLPLQYPAAGGIPWAKVDASGAKISDVSATSVSVRSAKVVHSYKITKLTRIRVDGRKADAQALKKGMLVNVTTSQLEPDVAMTIEATTAKGN